MGKCIKAITAGISGTNAPSHNSGIGTDGNLEWQYVDTLAVFKRFGLIEG